MNVFVLGNREGSSLVYFIQSYLTHHGVPVWFDFPVYPDSDDPYEVLKDWLDQSDLILIIITSTKRRTEIRIAERSRSPIILVALGVNDDDLPPIAAKRIVLPKPKDKNDFDQVASSVLSAIEEGGRKRIFISYARHDSNSVDQMRQLLSKSFHNHWIDRSSLRYGEAFPAQIIEAIRKCDLFLLCWSKNASTSEWVGKELMIARQNKRFIVPVIIDDEPLPPELSEVHAFTSFEGQEFGDFFKITKDNKRIMTPLVRRLLLMIRKSGLFL